MKIKHLRFITCIVLFVFLVRGSNSFSISCAEVWQELPSLKPKLQEIINQGVKERRETPSDRRGTGPLIILNAMNAADSSAAISIRSSFLDSLPAVTITALNSLFQMDPTVKNPSTKKLATQLNDLADAWEKSKSKEAKWRFKSESFKDSFRLGSFFFALVEGIRLALIAVAEVISELGLFRGGSVPYDFKFTQLELGVSAVIALVDFISRTNPGWIDTLTPTVLQITNARYSREAFLTRAFSETLHDCIELSHRPWTDHVHSKTVQNLSSFAQIAGGDLPSAIAMMRALIQEVRVDHPDKFKERKIKIRYSKIFREVIRQGLDTSPSHNEIEQALKEVEKEFEP